jgi:Protein of unknown function (DUF642)
MTNTAGSTTKAIAIANPGFNEPRITDADQWERYSPGDGAISGWSVTQGRVEIYSSGTARTPGGTQALELQGAEHEQGAAAQDIATTPDSQVTLTWSDSPDAINACHSANGSPTSQQYRVRITNGTFTVKESDFSPASGPGPQWTSRTLTFTPKDKTTRVEFVSRADTLPAYCGAMITGVAAQETIQAPPSDAPETTLKVWQQGDISDKPGGSGTVINVAMTQEQKKPTNPGVITQRFKAPTGFAWNSYATYAYYGYDAQVKGSSGHLRTQLADGSTTLVITGNPHLYTAGDDQDVLVYTLGIEAVDGAEPGRYTDGEARIGSAAPVKLKGTVIDPAEED